MKTTAEQKRIRLKEIFLREGCTPVPGVYDALGARMAEKTGFDAIYLGSFATATSVLGQPDAGCVTMTEMVSHAKNVANSVDIPLICDAENGFFHAANIWRTVREFEMAGVAAIHIEDHEFGKHTSLPPVLLDTDRMCKKIEAAVAARTDKNFMIIARTDAGWAMQSFDEMINRANRYLEAGADVAFLAHDPSYVTKEMRDRVKGPVLMTGSHLSSAKRDTETGLNVTIYYPLLINAAFVAMKEVLEQFKETQDASKLGKYNVPEKALYEYIPMDEFIEKSKKFLL